MKAENPLLGNTKEPWVQRSDILLKLRWPHATRKSSRIHRALDQRLPALQAPEQFSESTSEMFMHTETESFLESHVCLESLHRACNLHMKSAASKHPNVTANAPCSWALPLQCSTLCTMGSAVSSPVQ